MITTMIHTGKQFVLHVSKNTCTSCHGYRVKGRFPGTVWLKFLNRNAERGTAATIRRLHNKSQEERSWWAVEGSDTIYRCYRTSEYYEYWRYIESFIFLYLFIERSSFIWPTRFLLLHIELCVFSKVQIYKVKLELKPRLMQYNYFIQLNQHFLHGSQKQLHRLAS